MLAGWRTTCSNSLIIYPILHNMTSHPLFESSWYQSAFISKIHSFTPFAFFSLFLSIRSSDYLPILPWLRILNSRTSTYLPTYLYIFLSKIQTSKPKFFFQLWHTYIHTFIHTYILSARPYPSLTFLLWVFPLPFSQFFLNFLNPKPLKFTSQPPNLPTFTSPPLTSPHLTFLRGPPCSHSFIHPLIRSSIHSYSNDF